MKVWNAPEMEELDVRMTLNGVHTEYEESDAGWKQYQNDTGTTGDNKWFMSYYGTHS